MFWLGSRGLLWRAFFDSFVYAPDERPERRLPRRINNFDGWQPLLGAVGVKSRIDLSANCQPDFIMAYGVGKPGDGVPSWLR
jgi:hypothetical protein